MKNFVVILATTTLIFGCTPEYEQAATTAPSDTPPVDVSDEQPFIPMAYGDDPYFDVLWRLCDVDDVDACDDLYWESPRGSDYKRFADEKLEVLVDAVTEKYVVELLGAEFLFNLLWSEMTDDQQQRMCESLNRFGAAHTGSVIADTSGGLVTPEEAGLWLNKQCY